MIHSAGPSAEQESSLSKLDEFLLALQIKQLYSTTTCGSWRVTFTLEGAAQILVLYTRQTKETLGASIHVMWKWQRIVL